MADGFFDYLRGLMGWWNSTAEYIPPVIPPSVTPGAIGAPRWALSLHMYEEFGGRLLYTFPDPQGVVITDNEHGFESLTGFQEMASERAFWLYDLAPAKWLVLSCGGYSVWEGRLEDRKIQTGGFGFTAFGAKRYLDDVIWTTFWSTKSYAGIRPVTADEVTLAAPERWAMDNNNRIWFGLRAGETYNDDDHYGVQVWRPPQSADLSIRVNEIEFDYDVDLPTDWQARVCIAQEDFPGAVVGTVEWTLTSAGLPLSGTGTVVTNTAPNTHLWVVFLVRNNTGGNVTFGGETGAQYAKFTNFRVRGTPSAAVYADEIITAGVSYAANLAGGYALIQSPGVDLTDEVFEDTRISEMLSYLADKGDNQTPPRKWEWGVWESQAVFFRPQGDAAKHWYVDVDELTLDSTLESLVNVAYATYQDTNGRTRRTTLEYDNNSLLKYGVVFRFGVTQERTTSLTKAELARDTFLNQNSTIAPRASLTLYGLFDAAGALWPRWAARAGDTITIRNLPPTLSAEIDKIRTFRMSRKSYNVDTDILTPTPEYGLPTLELQIANALTFNNTPLLGRPAPGLHLSTQPSQPGFS